MLGSHKAIVVLTGAGISVPSGLRSYRGPGGLWNEPGVAHFSTKEGFAQDPEGCWQFWTAMKQRAKEAQPNEGHLALAGWEKELFADSRFTLITQNVDDLHQRAGSKNVVELHGSLFRTRCSDPQCSLPSFRDDELHAETPICDRCGSFLRPDIVLFGEMLPPLADHQAKKALRECDLFIAVGTSGTVSPASRFVEWAKLAEADTVLINLEASDPRNKYFDLELVGSADKILPSLYQ